MQLENTCPPSVPLVAAPNPQPNSQPCVAMAGLVGGQKQHGPRYEYMKKWYRDHKDENRIKHREWCRKNPHRRSVSGKKYYSTHKAQAKARNREWCVKNREKVAEDRRAYRIENWERIKSRMQDYSRRYYAKNKARIITRTKEYERAHPEIRRRCYLNYKRKHPGKYRAQNRSAHLRRRSRMRGADVRCPLVGSIIRGWSIEKSFTCYWCGRKFGRKKLHIDHIIAISRGGKHEASNICRSCALCNIRKRHYFQTESGFRGQMALL